MAATRMISKARAAAAAKAAPVAASIVAAAPKGFKPKTAPKTVPAPTPAPEPTIVDRLQTATYLALMGMDAARGKVASLVLVIRECQKAGMDKDTMGAHMQLGVTMLHFDADAAEAEAMLSAKVREPALVELLDNLKMTKCRAMAVIKREDTPKAAPTDAPKGKAGKGGKEKAKLLDPIEVPAPVNAAAFHAQLLKVRTLLQTAAKQAAEVGALEDVKAAHAAIAALPTT